MEIVLTPVVQGCRLARLLGKAPKDTELGQTGFFRPNVRHRLGKEQTGDPLDLRMNTGFVLVANNCIAFPMPEVPTAVHVFGALANGHSVGDFHRPAFSAQPAPSFPMAPRELLPQAQLTLRLIIDVLVNGLMVDVVLRWPYPFVDLFPQSSRDLLGRPTTS